MLACLLMTSLDSSWLPLACQQEMGLVWCSLVPSPSRGEGGGAGGKARFPRHLGVSTVCSSSECEVFTACKLRFDVQQHSVRLLVSSCRK